jgi:ABC-2 type transport system ATP-binding protein
MPLDDDAVVVTDLVKRFGRFTAVDHISFSVRTGEIFGFLGPNGAGKSTTIRMLCGIISPTSGTGRVAGFDLFTESERIKQTIGYMSQKFSLYPDLTPFENIRFYLGLAPASGPGLRPPAPAAAALSGRAHFGGRPHHAAAFLGFHPPAYCRRGDRLRHHSLHG